MATPKSTPYWTPARIAANARRQRTNPHRIEGDTAYITLTNQKGESTGEAMIDAEDLDRVLAFGSWHRLNITNNHGTLSYALASIRSSRRREQVSMHRLVLNTTGKTVVDHRNGDGLDNRKENLRTATRKENMLNNTLYRRVKELEAEVAHLRASLTVVAQKAHGAHGGRGSFRWCAEPCCSVAREVLDEPGK